MKIRCQKDELVNIIGVVQRAVMPKAQISILECIRIKADGGSVIFTGRNTDMGIEYRGQCEVVAAGAAALNAKMLSEIIKRMPEGAVTIDSDESTFSTRISCGKSIFNIQGMSPEEYPDIQKTRKDIEFEIPQSSLKRIIRKVAPFAAQTESKRPEFSGVLFDAQEGVLNAVATDGHRMARIEMEFENKSEGFKAIIPSATLKEMAKALKDDGLVNVAIDDSMSAFLIGSFTFTTRLLSGAFLNYKTIMDNDAQITAGVNKIKLEHCLDRAQLLISDDMTKENKAPVRLTIKRSGIGIACTNTRGSMNDVIPATVNGEELEIGFNCRFLNDGLKSCDEEDVKMEFSGQQSGMFMREDSERDKLTIMILPVRLYG